MPLVCESDLAAYRCTGLILFFLRSKRSAGGGPAAAHFLCFAKESKQRKGWSTAPTRLPPSPFGAGQKRTSCPARLRLCLVACSPSASRCLLLACGFDWQDHYLPFPSSRRRPGPSGVRRTAAAVKRRWVLTFVWTTIHLFIQPGCLRLCATNPINRLSRQRARSPSFSAGSAVRLSFSIFASVSACHSLGCCVLATSR
ncbi:hypothetical protein FB597_104284 [Herbaspirillum sp. SJZ099]|nr:hypothetical protein FB597_104284 [Herbaspirillum sp. SJZ099]